MTGRRANQLRYGALLRLPIVADAVRLVKSCDLPVLRPPNGIRTRVTAVKGQRPRPLDDGG